MALLLGKMKTVCFPIDYTSSGQQKKVFYYRMRIISNDVSASRKHISEVVLDLSGSVQVSMEELL